MDQIKHTHDFLVEMQLLVLCRIHLLDVRSGCIRQLLRMFGEALSMIEGETWIEELCMLIFITTIRMLCFEPLHEEMFIEIKVHSKLSQLPHNLDTNGNSNLWVWVNFVDVNGVPVKNGQPDSHSRRIDMRR
jgi:hypothetical protein